MGTAAFSRGSRYVQGEQVGSSQMCMTKFYIVNVIVRLHATLCPSGSGHVVADEGAEFHLLEQKLVWRWHGDHFGGARGFRHDSRGADQWCRPYNYVLIANIRNVRWPCAFV